ncbi:RNA polymerase sigma factor [Leptospira harrisiae]|uniref:RNA polymerase subunit sigma n=1 Tax=Leptospira harrisiae TaxID=2023189 RepID=A0A2N0AGH0_9LEPT|nr:RNA polymerase sigma factor [Leptospira harrisiae]PJZ83405.1 RNA polymerase subunit sigma [Leptospira harrisiae]PKA06770.1 RNA polymerase subunit sigma [Leptospira harrisiae]
MKTNQPEETQLIERARTGDRRALESLLSKVQTWIYNVIRRILLNPQEAEDLTQEVLLKIATNLAAYDPTRASFKTWAYRISVNHALNGKRGMLEEITTGFSEYANELEKMPNIDIPANELSSPENLVLIEEAKASCTLGMLLCLDREQRIALILADLMGLSDRESSELLDISNEAFRKRLSRARKDLYTFMDDKCGLMNEKNPCRCSKKMKSFQNNGWIDPAIPRFSMPLVRRLKEQVKELNCEYEDFNEHKYQEIFRDHPYFTTPPKILEELLVKYSPTI